MARPRTPTNVLALRGAFDKNPDRGRARANEPAPTKPLGLPPKHLTDEQKAVWRELAKRLPEGVAFDSDRHAFEMLAVLFAEFRASQLRMPPPQMRQIENLLGRFGLTPADRSKVKAIVGKKQADPWDDL